VKNRATNKILSFALAAVMLLTILPGVTAYAATEQKPDQPTVASSDVSAVVDKGGHATVTITDSMVSGLIDKAREQAKTDGRTANGDGVQLNVSVGASAKSIAIMVEANAIDRLNSEGVKLFAIANPLVNFSFDGLAIKEINTQSTGDVTVMATPEDKLSDAAKGYIGSRPAFDIAIRDGDGKAITDLKGGAVTLGIAYTPKTDEKTGNLYAACVPAGGKPELLTESSYTDGRVIFSGNTLTVCGVGYKTPAPAFTDTASHWAKDDIDFAVSRGLFGGTSDTVFSPDTAVTRGMFITALGRLSGADMSGYTKSGFSDVAVGSYYLPYIEWAVENKIVSGTGGGKFEPDGTITREDIAVMMLNYAAATGYKLPVTREAVTFADNADISAYAREAVKALQQAGVVSGMGNNRFNPKGTATRAEASTILRNFVELVIDTATARGWSRNEAGQWMYYNQNGKRVTSWLTTANNKYYFDTNGIMQAGKWMQINSNHYYFNANGKLAVSVSHSPTSNTYDSITITVTAEDNSDVNFIGWRSSSSGASYTGKDGFTDITKTGKFTASSNGWYAVGIVDGAGNFSYTLMQVTNISTSSSSGGSGGDGNGGSSSVAVTGVTLDANTLTLTVGGTQQLTATVTPSNATDKNVTWTSSDTSVATVTNGLVTAVASGSATITATTTNGKTASCAVTVNALVNAEIPSITDQPTDANFNVGDTAVPLTVTASVTDGGTLSYQWYSNTTNSTTGGSSVGSNSNSYTPLITMTGTTYYYVEITNTITNNGDGGVKTASVTSGVAAVTVTSVPFTYPIGFVANNISINGVTATGVISPGSNQTAGTPITVTITFTGTSSTAGTHTVGLTSSTLGSGISAPATVTRVVTAGENVTSSNTFQFAFTMPASAVNDLVLTHSFTTAQLPAPVITLSGQNISWNAVSSATGYDVYADSSKVASNISATSLTLSQLAGWIGSAPTSDVSVTVVAAAAQPTNNSQVSNSVTAHVFTDSYVIEIPIVSVSGNQITAVCSSAAPGASFRNVLVYLRTRTATVSSSSVSGNAITIDFTGYLDDGNDLAITITASAEGYFDKTFTSLFVCHAPNPWFSRE